MKPNHIRETVSVNMSASGDSPDDIITMMNRIFTVGGQKPVTQDMMPKVGPSMPMVKTLDVIKNADVDEGPMDHEGTKGTVTVGGKDYMDPVTANNPHMQASEPKASVPTPPARPDPIGDLISSPGFGKTSKPMTLPSADAKDPIGDMIKSTDEEMNNMKKLAGLKHDSIVDEIGDGSPDPQAGTPAAGGNTTPPAAAPTPPPSTAPGGSSTIPSGGLENPATQTPGGAPPPSTVPSSSLGSNTGNSGPVGQDTRGSATPSSPIPSGPSSAAPNAQAGQPPASNKLEPSTPAAANTGSSGTPKPEKFSGTIKDFQKANPGASVGQAMNAIQGKTAIAGGANDPNSKGFKGAATIGGAAPAVVPKGGAAPGAALAAPGAKPVSQGGPVPTPTPRPAGLGGAAPAPAAGAPKAPGAAPAAPTTIKGLLLVRR